MLSVRGPEEKTRPTIPYLTAWMESLFRETSLPAEIVPILNQRILVKVYEEFLSFRKQNTLMSTEEMYILFEKLISFDKRKATFVLIKAMLFYFVILIVITFSWRYRGSRPVNLLYHPPFSLRNRSTSSRLYDFLASPRFNFNSPYVYIVEHRIFSPKAHIRGEIIPVFSIDLFLISTFTVGERRELIFRSFKNLVKLIQLTRVLPVVSYSYRDLLLSIPVAQITLEKNLVSDILITNSNYLVQPAISHLRTANVRSFMLWYSDNSFPKYSDSSKSVFDYSAFGLAKVDCHFVWTEDFANFLSVWTKCPIKPVGSILFYSGKKKSNERTITESSSDLFMFNDLLIFDVTPFEEPKYDTYYGEERCLKFLREILRLQVELGRLVDGPLPNVGIKHKRVPSSLHSKSYLREIEMILRNNKSWQRLPEDANLYSLIANSKMVIAIPFTSPAIIAKELGIPCCYLDLGPNPTDIHDYSDIPVIFDFDDLLNFAKSVFGRR
jgi:hypothetical protein